MSNVLKHWQPVLLILLLVVLFTACFTLENSEYDRGYSREAMLNPWLAAGRLLERHGIDMHFSPEYGHLPPHAKVIVLATPLELLDAKEQAGLLDWVRDGGHLVTELQDVSNAGKKDNDNIISRQLDVRLREHDEKEEKEETADKAKSAATYLLPAQMDAEGTVQTRFYQHYYLQSGKLLPRWRVEDKNGAHVMRFALGDGHITVLSDSYWMNNYSIGQGDHAALLWRVINAQKRDEVWLIHGMQRPSLLALLWESAACFLLALSLFMLVWLWAASRRFGPVQKILPDARRRLSEHLEASGRYFLRHTALSHLFEASRQRLLAQVQRRHPQWKRLPPAQLAQHLAARAQIESGAVVRVLESDAPDHLLQFAADIRLINRLRKAL